MISWMRSSARRIRLVIEPVGEGSARYSLEYTLKSILSSSSRRASRRCAPPNASGYNMRLSRAFQQIAGNRVYWIEWIECISYTFPRVPMPSAPIKERQQASVMIHVRCTPCIYMENIHVPYTANCTSYTVHLTPSNRHTIVLLEGWQCAYSRSGVSSVKRVREVAWRKEGVRSAWTRTGATVLNGRFESYAFQC